MLRWNNTVKSIIDERCVCLVFCVPVLAIIVCLPSLVCREEEGQDLDPTTKYKTKTDD